MGKKQVRYSEAVADEICERLSNGESLLSICKDGHMPDQGSVYRWIAKYEEFATKYVRAREAQAEFLVDELVAIADNLEEDVQRSKLRLETRRWIAEKLRPKKYGPKVELAGEIGHKVSIGELSDEELAEIALRGK